MTTATPDDRHRLSEAETPRSVLRCPVHGIPDCSPILNGCSLPNRLSNAYAAGLAARSQADPAPGRPHHWINQNGRCDNGQMMDAGDDWQPVYLTPAPVGETREQIKAEALREAADDYLSGSFYDHFRQWLRARADRIAAKP